MLSKAYITAYYQYNTEPKSGLTGICLTYRMAKKKEGLSNSQNTFYPGFYFIRS